MLVLFRCLSCTLRNSRKLGCILNINSRKLKLCSGSIINQDRINNVKMVHELHSHENFRFMDYDCIGFDLDNTLCRYKISNMVRLEYASLSNYLIEYCGYPPKYLSRPIEDNVDFMLKGLILDVEKGNILRIDTSGHIIHGSHGTRELTQAELKKYYGEECRWHVTDVFSKNPLETWNGPFSERMRTLLDYFDMPAGLVFARAVDTKDEENGNKELTSYQIWPDILKALTHMFQKEHFQQEKGGYFPDLKNKPEDYIYKCSEKLINWLKSLRAEKKLLFLITGSNVDFASHTAQNCMGDNWKDYFDIVIFFARKPGFFLQNRPFIGLNGMEETGEVGVEDLQIGGQYVNGNWEGLYEFLKKHSKKDDPKILYVGDNIVQDVFAPSVHTQCDTIVVCEELEAEGVFGHEPVHEEGNFLVSNKWGSYFHHTESDKSTIWKHFIMNHSKLCIPSLEYVATFPIDHDFLSKE